jgi:hypothetical protein
LMCALQVSGNSQNRATTFFTHFTYYFKVFM